MKGITGNVGFTAGITMVDVYAYSFWVSFGHDLLRGGNQLVVGKARRNRESAEADLKEFLADLGAIIAPEYDADGPTEDERMEEE